MPVPAPRAIRASVTDNSRMGPSPPARAPFAQVFLAEESTDYIGCADPPAQGPPRHLFGFRVRVPPSPPRSGACIAWPKEHPPTLFRARTGGESGAGPPGNLRGQVLRRVCRGWGEQGEVQGLGDAPTRHRAERRRLAGSGPSWAPEWAPAMHPRLSVRRARRQFIRARDGRADRSGGAGASGRAAARGAICLSGWTPAPNWEILINY